MERYELITSPNQEDSCTYCGFPLRLGVNAVSLDGRLYCTKTCAHRMGTHDSHRRKLTDEERAAFYSQAKQTHGRALVAAHAEQPEQINYDWRA